MDDIYRESQPEVNGIQAYDSFKTGSITLDQLKAVAESQGTEIKFRDILIIRSGYINSFNKPSKDQAEAYASVVPPNLSGVEQSEAVLGSFWEHFSATAGDQPSFECWREYLSFAIVRTLRG
ncbi:hypothetical protein N7G274_008463 [Stereocaulon virgatum]|uniref:EF-hand domain-containing protein n=1 Tax=Stereocaulon virgatum TaxID=373712 RepID=A0ABR3ZYK5_9LECA